MDDSLKKSSATVCTRICLNGSYGTVKYYGEVQGKGALWYGVDWDDPKRGKHDGNFAGVRYFSAEHPTSGSFVDPSKVDTGVSLASAIAERYIHCYESLADEDRLLPQKSKDRLIEFVGAEKVAKKISQIHKLEIADVSHSRVSHVGAVSSVAPNLTHLDLSTNLVSDWSAIAEILNQLPLLTELDLSGNRLRLPKTDLPSYPQLTTMIMMNMKLVWNDIVTLATFLSSVQRLTLVSNRICFMETPMGILQNLIDLDLSKNQIALWDEVLKLGHLPKLTTLNLTENSLCQIRIPQTLLFPSLQSLNLSSNEIGSWTDVAELNKLQNLERLFLAGNPILQLESPQNCRQLVIAKIGSLKILEGIEITRQERRGAEWDYIKRYWTDWQNRQNDCNFIMEHNRYETLIKIHGKPEISGKQNLSHEKIPTISPTIFCPLMPEKPSVTRKIPANILVGKLKQMIKRWLHISENNVILSYKTQQEGGPEYPIDDDTQVLSFYAVTNGDRIYVQW